MQYGICIVSGSFNTLLEHSPAAQFVDNAPEDGEEDLRDVGEEFDQCVGRQVEKDRHGLEVHALLL